MSTFDASPLFRAASAGFERPWDAARTALNMDAGLPPYNVLKTGEQNYQIWLAVPGYRQEDLTIETRENTLWVRGEQRADPSNNQYLYRGISMPGFERTFQLPEHMRVTGARLESGMLILELVRELPEALRPRRIEIEVSAPGDTHQHEVLEDTSRAA